MMWMEFIVKRAVRSVTATSASTLFPGCVWLPWGFIGCRKFWQAFFSFFCDDFVAGNSNLGGENSGRMECHNAFSISVEGDNPVTIRCLHYGLEIKSTACLPLALRV